MKAVSALMGGLIVCMALSASLSNAEDDNSRTIKVDVDLVLVTATVTDRQGALVTGLSKDDFQVWEDKVEQKIEYFSAEELPVSVGIVLDTSASMERKISAARDAAVTILKSGSPEDEYFLVEFNNRAQMPEDFSTDTGRIQNRLVFSPVEGKTALFDAVYLALEKLKHGGNPRKALVLITDGEDNNSRYSLSDIREFVREADVQVFAIGSNSHVGVRKGVRSGRVVLEQITQLTGGKAFFPRSANELEDISDHIALELRSQYVLGYVSTHASKDGKWRKVRARVNPPKGASPVNVRSKTGYYASAP